MPSLYEYQKDAVRALLGGKQICVANCGAGKGSISLYWARAQKKPRLLVITTASKRDVCFPSGTKIKTIYGDKNIEDISVGDKVFSYNGEIAVGNVSKAIKIETKERLYKLTFGGCCNIIATENHPIYIGNGRYKPIKDIEPGEYIYGIRSTEKRGSEKTYCCDGETIKRKSTSKMFFLPKRNKRADKIPERPMVETGNDVLFKKLFKEGSNKWSDRIEQQRVLGKIPKWNGMRFLWGKNRAYNINYACDIQKEQEAFLLNGLCSKKFGEFKKRKFYQCEERRENQKSRTLCKNESEEWYKDKRTPKKVSRHIGWRNGICGEFAKVKLGSVRCCSAKEAFSDRDRRKGTQWSPEEKTRRTKGFRIGRIRVESVEVFGQDTTRKNIVYCLSVDEFHNYFANGILVHNCDELGRNDFEAEADMWFGEGWRKSLSSFETISWAGVVKWTEKNLARIQDYAIIADEIACAKNGVSSQRGRAFLKIASMTNCWTGYTATPADNWMEMCAYFVATGKIKNKTTFMREFCDIQTYKGYPEIVGYHNTHILKKWWEEISDTVDTSEMERQLPKANSKMVYFKLPTGYKNVLKTHYSPAGEPLETTGAICSCLRQMCFTDAKKRWISEFVEHLGDRAVMFYNFTSTGDTLEEIVKKALPKGARVWRIDGQRHEIPNLQTMGERDIVIVQWQAGAHGLNLQFVNRFVSVEQHYSWSLSTQAKGRIRRVGQDRPQFYYWLCCERGIERDVYEALRNKREFVEESWALQNNIIEEK